MRQRGDQTSCVRVLSASFGDPRVAWVAGVVAAGLVVAGRVVGAPPVQESCTVDDSVRLACGMRPTITVDGAQIDAAATLERIGVRPDGAVELRGEIVLPSQARISWSVAVGISAVDAADADGASAPPEGLASLPPISHWFVTAVETTNLASASTTFVFEFDTPLVDSSVQFVGGGSFGLLVDGNGDGATIDAPGAGAIYTSLIDEADVGQAMNQRFSAFAPGGATNWIFGSHGSPIPSDPAPPVTSGFGMRLSYVISAGDSAQITSIVVLSQ